MLATIGKFVLDWLYGKLSSLVAELVRFAQRKSQVEKEAEESVRPIKDAETEKEIDDAAKDLLGKL